MSELAATRDMIKAAIVAYSKATNLEYSEKAIRKAMEAALVVQATHVPDEAMKPATDDPGIPRAYTEYDYALNLAKAMREKHYPEVPQWEPLPDLMGLLTQIDNMTTGLSRTIPAEGS